MIRVRYTLCGSAGVARFMLPLPLAEGGGVRSESSGLGVVAAFKKVFAVYTAMLAVTGLVIQVCGNDEEK